MGFLAHIREWGEKVIFIVNGIDRRNSDEQIGRVRDYLTREITARLGGDPPTIYFISALQSLRAKLAARSETAATALPPPLTPEEELSGHLRKLSVEGTTERRGGETVGAAVWQFWQVAHRRAPLRANWRS